jgi:hypothetical protein
MNKLFFGLLLMLIICCLGGCAGRELGTTESSPGIGTRESDLIAQKGQPQQILTDPPRGKILVYQNDRLDQMAGMRGGVWSKPEQVHYSLDSSGVVTKVTYYPYGKRKFIFPTEKEPAAVAQVPAQPAGAGSLPQPVTVQPPPREPAGKPVSAPTPPAKAAPPAGMEAASRLELRMSKDMVRRLLGVPDRTEGYRVGGKTIITWFYSLRDKQDRLVTTPLVFEDGFLAGWGESYYLRLPKGGSSSIP